MVVLAAGILLLPDNYVALAAALAISAAVFMVGSLIYLSFFLRCPRCSGWVAIMPKCLSCGLKLEPK